MEAHNFGADTVRIVGDVRANVELNDGLVGMRAIARADEELTAREDGHVVPKIVDLNATETTTEMRDPYECIITSALAKMRRPRTLTPLYLSMDGNQRQKRKKQQNIGGGQRRVGNVEDPGLASGDDHVRTSRWVHRRELQKFSIFERCTGTKNKKAIRTIQVLSSDDNSRRLAQRGAAHTVSNQQKLIL